MNAGLLISQTPFFKTSLDAIAINEKKVNKLPSLTLPKNPTKDDYISHLNKLEIQLDLTEKLKNQYINLEKEILKTEVKPTPKTIEVSTPKNNSSQLRNLLVNKVHKNNLLEDNTLSSRSQSMIDEMYLSQVLENHPTPSSKTTNVKSVNTQTNNIDSLHSIVIDKIVLYEDNGKRLKAQMKSVSEKLKKRTHIQYSNSENIARNTPSQNTSQSYNAVAINIQNILRKPEVKDKPFAPRFDQDNKLIEDRKGFITPPMLNSSKAVRYESPINGSKHDGIVLKSKNANVTNISQGVVSKIGTTSSNKKFIVIKHDNDYMSVYSNLNQTFVNENEFVKYNQVIGDAHKINNQDFTIHFQLWKGSKSQNPSHWLKNN